MTSLNAVAGLNTGESGGQTWLCADESNATSLLAGDKSYKPAKPYISISDIVCVAQDGSKDTPPTIYTCLDRSQPPGDPSELNAYTGYTNSCDNYLRSYLDISNSLTTLLHMKLAAFDGSQNLVKSLDALKAVYGQYKCAGQTTPSVICNSITQSVAALQRDIDKVNVLTKPIEDAAMPARASRATMVNALNEYRCGYKIPP